MEKMNIAQVAIDPITVDTASALTAPLPELPPITAKTTLGELLGILNLEAGQKREGRTPKRAGLMVAGGEPVVQMCGIRVYKNGYALYENGFGKYSVVWLPYCTRFTYYFSKLRDAEKDYLDEKKDLPDGILETMAWTTVIALFGEERITKKLNRGFGNCDTAEENANDETSDDEDEDDEVRNFTWDDDVLGVNPLDALIRKENREEMLAAMTDKQREVFVLYHKYGMSQREIAEYLHINQKAVSDRLKYATKKSKNFFLDTTETPPRNGI